MILALTVPRSGTHFVMWLLAQLGVDARFCHARRVHEARIAKWAAAGVRFVSSVRNPWDTLRTTLNKFPDDDLTETVLDEHLYMEELRERYTFCNVRVEAPCAAELAVYCGVAPKLFAAFPVVGWGKYETSVQRPVDTSKMSRICKRLGYAPVPIWNKPKVLPTGPAATDMVEFMETRHAINNPWSC